jgi:uncharacterized protein
MRFTWDERKNAANVRKHGINFRDAVRIFDGEVVEWIDRRFTYDEERWSAIGIAEKEEVYVAYVEKGPDIKRLISARLATQREREIYWRQVGR